MAEREKRLAPSDLPATAVAEKGVVLLDGPQGAVSAMTPEAAAATGENLRRAASLAVQQRRSTSEPVPLRPKD
jgi:hypothetical protein